MPTFYRSSDELLQILPSELQQQIYTTMLSRIKEEPLQVTIGTNYVSGSNFPSHSDVHISCLTGLKIQVLDNRTGLHSVRTCKYQYFWLYPIVIQMESCLHTGASPEYYSNLRFLNPLQG